MLKKIFSNDIPAWLGIVLLTVVYRTSAEIQAPLAVEPKNQSSSEGISFNSGGLLHLFERQSGCYSPNLYCALYNKCCASNQPSCCSDGCYTTYVAECCQGGGSCAQGKQCCYDGCMPTGSQCCRDGSYCPQPYICVIYQGVLGCCTDLTCRVYLSSGVARTATQTSTSVASTSRAAISFTTTSYTSAYRSYTSAVAGYTTYTTIVYWYYWYYFYTIYYNPVTYTTRTYTSVTRTTTLTCSATNSLEADDIFYSSSSNLPVPAYAEVTIPVVPTSGATVLGRCTPSSTTSVCDTAIADGRGVYSTSGGQSNPTADSTSSSGQRSGAHMETVPWIPFVIAPAFVFGVMIML